MSGDVTQLLMRIERGELQSADQLLPLVYAELTQVGRRSVGEDIRANHVDAQRFGA